MKHSEEQDPAWDLLKNARQADVPPTFAQDVLREVRQLEGESSESEVGWFSLRWGAALVGAAALLVGGFFVLKQPASTEGGDAPGPAPIAEVSYEQEITIEEFQAELDELAYLSELMDVSDTSLLPDEDLAALLF